MRDRPTDIPTATDFDHCPLCGSNQLEGGAVTIEENHAWQNVSCGHCNSHWTETYKASGRYDIDWDDDWDEFGLAEDQLREGGAFDPSIDQTGGGIKVMYIRLTFLQVMLGATDNPIGYYNGTPQIGITRSEDHSWDDPHYLVVAYDHAEDEGGEWFRTVGLAELSITVNKASDWLTDRHRAMTVDQARSWAQEQMLTDATDESKFGWVLRRLNEGRLGYSTTRLGDRHTSYDTWMLAGPDEETHFCVHWRDEIVNEWHEWYDGEEPGPAYLFLGRLIAAVAADQHIDEVAWHLGPKVNTQASVN